MLPHPIQFLLFMLAGWASRQQQQAIDYLQSGAAKPLGRALLREPSPILTPDTLLRWYLELVAMKYPPRTASGQSR